MTGNAKIIEIGTLMANAWHDDEPADGGAWYEQQLKQLDDNEVVLVYFACKMLLGERPFGVNTDGRVDPRLYEIAEMLGAQAVPQYTCRPGISSVVFVPPGLEAR
jgi:hypothetical protein